MESSGGRTTTPLLILGDYRVLPETIGTGSYSCVRRGVHLRTHEPVAVKVVPLSMPTYKDRAYREADMLKELGKHKHIVSLYDVYKHDNALYLFMEYANGGDLFSYLQRRGPLAESKARFFFKQCVDALSYCHQRGVAHHDVKLENMLLATSPSEPQNLLLRLSDFGLSQRLHDVLPDVCGSVCGGGGGVVSVAGSGSIVAYCGSPLYMAPEVFSMQPHGEQVDVWSLGVCLFVMVSGAFPFVANNYTDLEERVCFDEVPLLYGTVELNDLIQGMLRKDPLKRYTLPFIKQHAWMVMGVDRTTTTTGGVGIC